MSERRDSGAATAAGQGQGSWTALAIVEKYEQFIDYFYPVLQNAPRRQSVIRAKRVIRTLAARGDHARLDRFLGAWIGHARWADSHNLLSSLHIEDRHAAH